MSSRPFWTSSERFVADVIAPKRMVPNRRAKRAFDLVIAVLGLIVLAPAFGLLALAIKLDSPGPVFHRGLRIGMFGKSFDILKFRTMVVTHNIPCDRITTAGDLRVTRVGQFLRWTKVDELPQLVNVLRGEMSLVGPRPEDPFYVSMYSDAQRRVLNVRPGITSLAAVIFRHETRLLEGDTWESVYIHQILPKKLALDLDYLNRITLAHDLRVLWLTARALIGLKSSQSPTAEHSD